LFGFFGSLEGRKMYISVTCDYFMHDFVRNEQKNRCDGLEAAFFSVEKVSGDKVALED
jgi:hypothetical protein